MKNTILVATLVLPVLFWVGCGKSGLPSRPGTDADVSPRDAASDPLGTPDVAPDQGPDLGTKDSGPLEPPDAVPDSGNDAGTKDSGLVETPDAIPDSGSDAGIEVPAPDVPNLPDLGAIDGVPTSTPVLYAMSASLHPVDGGYPGTSVMPPSFGFSLLVDWNGNKATTGANGIARQLTLRQTGDNDWEATEPLTFNLGLSSSPSMTYSTLKLTRGKDGCSATATGTYRRVEGDMIFTTNIESSITGIPDKAGPILTVVPGGEVHPLAFTGIISNELLPSSTSASLDTEGTSLVLTSSPGNGAPGASAFLLPGTGLAFGSTYKLRVQPDAIDLVGNRTAELPSFTTLADPGLLAQDGFEGTIQAYTLGFTTTTSSATLPIPAGSKALACGASFCSARFTARLAVKTGATSVKFAFMTYRPKTSMETPTTAYSFTVAVPNGAAESTYDYRLKTAPLPKPWTGDPPGSDVNTYSDLLEAQLPLPSDTGSEILFDMLGFCAQPGPPPPGLIIDSLRVE
jgi:hypothetical protein